MNHRHHPPTHQDDFSRATNADSEALAQGWHDSVAGWISERFAALPPDEVHSFDDLDPRISPIPSRCSIEPGSTTYRYLT